MIFIQRDPATGTGDVTFTGDEARILRNGEVVVGWTSGGIIPDVPQGDGYTLEVRSGGQVATQDLAIGAVVMAAGQSNMTIFFRFATAIPPEEGTYQMLPSGEWSFVRGTAARTFTATLSEQLGVPVALVDATVSGSSLVPEGDYGFGYWLSRDDPNSGFNRALATMQLAGATPEMILWSQGEADTKIPYDRYVAALDQLFSWFASDLGGPQIAILEVGPRDTDNAGTMSDAVYAGIRAAQHAVAEERADTVIGAYTLASDLLDPVHLDGPSRAQAAAHLAFARLEALGLGGQINHVVGSVGSTVIQGTAGTDNVDAGGGNDEVRGGDGRDVLFGSGGNDTLYGDNGNDIVRGGTGDDALYGGSGNDIIGGGAGNDRIWGGNQGDEIWGGYGNDVIYGEAGDDLIYGDDNDDIIEGGLGNDKLFGGDGNDTLRGGEGNDELSGEAGDNELYGDAGFDLLTGGAGNDLLDGGSGNDVLIGGAGNDRLFGRDGMDRLDGGLGQDQLYGGAGDTLLGGDGNDYLEIDGATTLADGGAGADRLRIVSNLTAVPATIVNIEQVEVASGYRVDLSAIGSGLSATALSATGATTKIFGTQGNDLLTGGSGDDVLYGRGGIDTLIGGAGRDTLIGGAGDTLRGGDGNDYLEIDGAATLVDGGAGNGDRLRVTADIAFATGSIVGIERIEVANGAATDFSGLAARVKVTSLSVAGGGVSITGTGFDDVLTGATGRDTLIGGNGRDTLYGGAGDRLFGGAGGDCIEVSGAPLLADGGAGSDKLRVTGNVDFAEGSISNFEMYEVADGAAADFSALAGAFKVTLLSKAGGGSTIIGGDGADSFTGGSGNDRLTGGTGNDLLSGGAGDDHFVFGPSSGKDTLRDFGNGQDRLDVAAYGYGALQSEIRLIDGDDLIVRMGADQIRLQDFLVIHGESDLMAVRSGSGELIGFQIAAGISALTTPDIFQGL